MGFWDLIENAIEGAADFVRNTGNIFSYQGNLYNFLIEALYQIYYILFRIILCTSFLAENIDFLF